jgi:hypothetical protein
VDTNPWFAWFVQFAQRDTWDQNAPVFFIRVQAIINILAASGPKPLPTQADDAARSEFERPNGEQIKQFRPLHRPNHPKQNRDFH